MAHIDFSLSAIDKIGPHLLGASPYRDPADFPISLALDAKSDLEVALAVMQRSSSASAPVKAWAKLATPLILAASPAPDPTPTPAPTPQPGGPIMWEDVIPALDQGQTPHCVGFAGAQWGNTAPVEDRFADSDGHAFYYACKLIDRQALQENGTSIHSLGKVLAAQKRIGAYLWATTVDEIVQWLSTRGPVILGTDWTEQMFYPDSKGFVRAAGGIIGAHGYVALGVDLDAKLIWCRNNWSPEWGLKGNFSYSYNTLDVLLGDQGEAMVGLELALAA